MKRLYIVSVPQPTSEVLLIAFDSRTGLVSTTCLPLCLGGVGLRQPGRIRE